MAFQTLMIVPISVVLFDRLFALIAPCLAIVWTVLGVFKFACGAFVALANDITCQPGQTVTGGFGVLVASVFVCDGHFLSWRRTANSLDKTI